RDMSTPSCVEPTGAGHRATWQRMRARAGDGRLPVALPALPVEDVVGVERNQAAIGMGDVDAGLLHRADVEGVDVHELHDEHPEDVRVAQLARNGDLREATQ